MCESLDRWEKEIQAESIQKGIEKGRARGEEDTTLRMIKEMLEKGLSEEFVLSFTGVNKLLLSQAKKLMIN